MYIVTSLIFLLLNFQVAQPCAPRIKPEDYYTTSTLDNVPLTKTTERMIVETTTEMAVETTEAVPVSECSTCSIDDIVHDTVFSIEYADPTPDGCRQLTANCVVPDNCTSGFLYAKNPDGEIKIGDRTDSMIIARLTCGAEGKWGIDTTTNIEQLRCSSDCGSVIIKPIKPPSSG